MHRVISRWLRWLNCMHYTSNCFLIHRIPQIWPLVTITCSQTSKGCSRETDLASRKKSSPKLKLILRVKINRSARKVLRSSRTVGMIRSLLEEPMLMNKADFAKKIHLMSSRYFGTSFEQNTKISDVSWLFWTSDHPRTRFMFGVSVF